MRGILFLLFLSFGLSVSSQDTLRVMHYNLLNYGNCFTGCTASNNNTEEKDEYLRRIVRYVNPSILTVNELCVEGDYQQRILDAVLNDGWIGYYRRAGIQNQAGSDMVNQLYYDSRKLVFHSHRVVQSYVRDIDLFKLYYYSNDLAQGDTTFLYCIVAHLKAGNDPDDEQKRSVMTGEVMAFLKVADKPENRLFMGDLNVYRASEAAYRNLVNESDLSLRFFDPVNQTGEWHNNLSYSGIHTQSTRAGETGCGAPGGMDDRFDFILMSNALKEGQFSIHYIEGSYKALGQDGQHFNLSVNDPPANTSVPAGITEALYGASDHLPVVMDLRVDKTLGVKEMEWDNLTVTNPVTDFAEILHLPGRKGFGYRWIDVSGRIIRQGALPPGSSARIRTPAEKGFYLLQIFSDERFMRTFRLIRH